MGCHTWCLIKINRSYEEAKKKWIQAQLETIARWELMIAVPTDLCRVSYQWTEDDLQNHLKIFKRQLRMVENGLCKVAVMNNQPDDDEGRLYRFVNGNLYADNKDTPHDIFRIGGYPSDQLFSIEETLNFIEKNKDKVQLLSDSIKRLEIFWDTYPEAMIEFG